MLLRWIKSFIKHRRGMSLLEAIISMNLFALFMMIWFDNMTHQLEQLHTDRIHLEQNEQLLQEVVRGDDTMSLVLLSEGGSDVPTNVE
ncbi:hypothetical protein [Aerococcus vaginalis]